MRFVGPPVKVADERMSAETALGTIGQRIFRDEISVATDQELSTF
jgi:hypothetical protein